MHASSRRGVSAASVDKRPLIIKRITGCGKLWGFDGGTADGHKPPSAVYAKNSAGETERISSRGMKRGGGGGEDAKDQQEGTIANRAAEAA